jgi:hypothetical protein
MKLDRGETLMEETKKNSAGALVLWVIVGIVFAALLAILVATFAAPKPAMADPNLTMKYQMWHWSGVVTTDTPDIIAATTDDRSIVLDAMNTSVLSAGSGTEISIYSGARELYRFPTAAIGGPYFNAFLFTKAPVNTSLSLNYIGSSGAETWMTIEGHYENAW